MKNALWFALGAVVGGLVAWKVTENVYLNKIDEKINEYLDEEFNRQRSEGLPDKEPTEEVTTIKTLDDVVQAYDKIQGGKEFDVNAQFIDGEQIDENNPLYEGYIVANRPYLEIISMPDENDIMTDWPIFSIKPEEFGAHGRETEVLYFNPNVTMVYSKEKMSDETDEYSIGIDFDSYFGEYETDVVYVRNSYQRKDYKIILEDSDDEYKVLFSDTNALLSNHTPYKLYYFIGDDVLYDISEEKEIPDDTINPAFFTMIEGFKDGAAPSIYCYDIFLDRLYEIVPLDEYFYGSDYNK